MPFFPLWIDSYYSFYVWRVYVQKQITPFLIFKNHVFYYVVIFFIVFYYVSYLVFFSYFLHNQNNPIAVWLRLIGMHNKKQTKKTWFLKIVKNGVICFCTWTLHMFQTMRQKHNIIMTKSQVSQCTFIILPHISSISHTLYLYLTFCTANLLKFLFSAN